MSSRAPLPAAVDSEALPPAWQGWKADTSIMPAGTASAHPDAAAMDGALDPPQSPADRAFLDYQPSPRDAVPAVWEFHASDDGRAAFFLAHFGEILRYVPELNQWRIWHGHRWHPDTTGRAGHFCQLLSRHQLQAAAALRTELADTLAAQIDAAPDAAASNSNAGPKLKRSDVEKEANYAKSQAAALGNEKTIAALLDAAARTGSVIVPLAQWDASPWLVGTANGALDLRTRQHRPGAPGDYITRGLAVAYDPHATAPEWGKFIARILPADLAAYVRTLAGYSLTGSTDDHAFYFLYGTGKNGKSIFIETLAALFRDYAGKARRTLIEEPRNGADCKHDLAQLPGVRFLHGEETSSGGRLREDVIKSLTAGDTLTGEAKYAAPFSFSPMAKLWLMGNHKPRIEGTDPGIWRRVRLIPFTATISDSEEIPASELLARFAGERPGILNWMLAGLAAWKSGPVPMPPAVRAAVAEYRQSEDELGEFISECTQDALAGYKEPKQDVFHAYQKWATENGITRQWTARQFTARLMEREGWQLDPGRRSWKSKSIRCDAPA